MKRWKHSIATEEPFEMVFQLRRHDGSYRWFLTRIQRMRDEHPVYRTAHDTYVLTRFDDVWDAVHGAR